MALLLKIKAILFLSMVWLITIPAAAVDRQKVRIHIPIKHHTHYHTKTLIKTVHVPVKTHSPPVHKHKHAVVEVDDDSGQFSDYWAAKSYSKKKKHH